MSVSLSPSSSLGFNRPLTQLVKRTLTITNNNATPVAFKVKTTAPKLYCVRPNTGKVKPGEHVEVSVMLQPMKEEPPTATKCKDKFLIQSIAISDDRFELPVADIWTASTAEDVKVHQHKIRVVYLPAEGQIVEEEEESPIVNGSAVNDSQKYSTVRQHLGTDATTAEHIPDFAGNTSKDLSLDDQDHPGDYAESHEEVPVAPVTNGAIVSPPSPAAARPVPPVAAVVTEPAPAVNSVPAPTSADFEAPPSVAELETQLYLAQAEIERLRFMLNTSGEPDHSVEEDHDTSGMALRQRKRQLSDATSTAAATHTDFGTVVEGGDIRQPDGVPLNVVLAIAVGVFMITYLFF